MVCSEPSPHLQVFYGPSSFHAGMIGVSFQSKWSHKLITIYSGRRIQKTVFIDAYTESDTNDISRIDLLSLIFSMMFQRNVW